MKHSDNLAFLIERARKKESDLEWDEAKEEKVL